MKPYFVSTIQQWHRILEYVDVKILDTLKSIFDSILFIIRQYSINANVIDVVVNGYDHCHNSSNESIALNNKIGCLEFIQPTQPTTQQQSCQDIDLYHKHNLRQS
ncbi:hypothetical protein DERP_002850 [Dermatophagoides pteronyssinus]|uniref:Uncharacterized protein n=1 Tax=Dermatophagoides pteronyssinus TaxID=6956 RepID=A0ABQ8JW99_DERPT|nr:hypothetical protein DERP_002850 [Dermatophagoides pteronyssinus]